MEAKAKSNATGKSTAAQTGDHGRGAGSSNPVKKTGSVSMDHVLLAMRETKEERDLRMRSLFNFFDAANNGYLDYEQIEADLSALQIPPEYKYAKELLKVCDANRDGRVDYHEFRRYMDDKELELYRIFQAIDVEHNGCILPEELWDALVKAGFTFAYIYIYIHTHLRSPTDCLVAENPQLHSSRQSFSSILAKMRHVSQNWLLSSVILLLALSTQLLNAFRATESKIKSAVFLSPKIVLGPGSVVNKFYYDIEFPRGHIAIKSFNAEVIDEAGNPIPLQETYLHHWVVARYHQRKNVTQKEYDGHRVLSQSDHVFVRNNGICQKDTLGQYFGLGSETRGTATDIPGPFGIEIGNPAEISEGYEEKWMLNVHAIDTRNVEDKLGCTECKCDLYNITKDEYGRPLRPDYVGGFLCCYDNTQCRKREGFEGPKRTLYLRYTVKWVDWDDSVVPVKIYILDVTDTLKIPDDSKGISPNHNCLVEYEVKPCSIGHKDANSCIDVKKTSLPMPSGGYVIYGVAHQHSGGIGSTLYGQDGRVICSSIPTYGKGEEAGNEAGYIVGMSTCYPRPGSVNILDGETLTLESRYNSSQLHTGVMGLFYLLVAERLPPQHISHSSRASFFANNINYIIY
ncbi:hypothetical protein L6164_014941 [Bauhinia variegata]|uniref:Uncharacterized protein n=1 Tax=Bauhinia variegata TaxID=167791 RepID=A0ACB9NNT9_BAUVA|nr:hypothetical protein L6164_014941 [Bauhinia variegata]